MMHKLAAFIMAGRWQATVVTLGFSLLGLIIPPSTLLGGAALALVTLRLGAPGATSVLALAVITMTALSALATGQASIGAAYGLLQLMPVLLLALVLRATISLALTLQVATAMGLIAVLGIEYLTPDIDLLWERLLEEIVRPVLVRAQVSNSTVDAMLGQAARIMTGSLIAAMLLSLSLTLLIARWWQALLYNPGGFREEFTQLQLGLPAAVLALALAAGAWLSKASLMIELALVASVMFLLQGMAVAHAVIAKTASPTLWLAGVYGLLVLVMPQMMAALAAMGAVDTFADFRARLTGEPKNG